MRKASANRGNKRTKAARLLAAIIALMFLTAQHALAQEDATTQGEADAPAKPDLSNAATWYLQAAAKQRAVRHTDAQEDAVARFDGDPSRGPSPQMQQILRRYQPVIMLVRRAARRENCDFSVGIETTSPDYLQRLAQARSVARVVRLDFQQRIFNNDTQGATESIIVYLRMAGHFANEDTMIGSTVGAAVLALADNAMQVALDHAIIGPFEAAALLREIDRFDPEDPARFRIAARTEMNERLQPLLASFTGEGGIDRLRDHLRDTGADLTPERVAQLDAISQERLDEIVTQAIEASSKAIALLDERDLDKALAGMQAIRDDINTGDLGPLAQTMGLQVKALDLLQRSRKMLGDRRAVIAGIANGLIEPMSLANAAVWHIRATLQMEGIDPVKIAAIDAYAAKHDQPADPTLTSIFNRFDVQSVVDSLRTATTVERCDFAYANWSSSVTFSSYHAGMLACGRLLVADAARLFHEQRYFESAECLAIAYRMSADLAGDGKVAGSLAAHRIFADADALADAAIDSRMLAQEHIVMLGEAVRTLSRGDPFHYQPAIASMRQAFEYTMTYFVQGLPKDLPPATKEEEERAAGILAAMSPDRLLSFAIAYEYWERSAYWPDRTDPSLAAAGLDTIYDMNAFGACADVAPNLSEWSRGRLMENVLEGGPVAFPVIAPLEERARQSIADYRRCVLRMNRLAPEQGAAATGQASESSAD
jgi:hypothetical protein